MHAGIMVRAAECGDHAAFARFYAELEVENPVPDAARWEVDMMPHSLFLEEAGRTVAYAFVEVFEELGYVRHVVVDRGARGRGMGRVLMDVIAARLRERACTRWELNVKRDNHPAIRLYESVGMSVAHQSWALRIDWADALRVPAGGDVVARGVDAMEEARIEREMRLPAGKVRKLRAQPGQVLLQLVDAGGTHLVDAAGERLVHAGGEQTAGSGGEVRGFARFDPRHPGAFPFRVKSPEHAGVLLRALHPHRAPGYEWMQLVIEDDEATARLLMEHGARCLFEMLHYGGTLPPAQVQG